MNGNALTFKWLAGILIGIVTIGIAAFLNSTYARVNNIESSHQVLVGEISASEEHNKSVDDRLNRIENKLDTLISKEIIKK